MYQLVNIAINTLVLRKRDPFARRLFYLMVCRCQADKIVCMMVRTDTDILLFSMHSDECPGCYKYWFDTVCDHISGVISRLSYLRHDVIRTLFPYHYTGI